MNKVRKALALPASDWLLIAQAWLWFAAVEIGLCCLSLRTLLRIIQWRGRAGTATMEEWQPHQAIPQRAADCVELASRLHVLNSTCLRKAVVLYALLTHRGFDAELLIGAAKATNGQLDAHAWLECQGKVLLGEPAPGRYQPFVLYPVPSCARNTRKSRLTHERNRRHLQSGRRTRRPGPARTHDGRYRPSRFGRHLPLGGGARGYGTLYASDHPGVGLRAATAHRRVRYPVPHHGRARGQPRRVDLRPQIKRREGLRDDTDAEIVLKAYECWGQDCPVRILGDFAFVIWDKRQRQLFCARDQLGVKPLYYARVGNSVLFSNSIAGLRINPNVSAKLNERAIGDFLLFDCNMDLSTTTFADIRRVPPAHCLAFSDVNQSARRYWIFLVEDEIRYPRWRDYVDQFNALMRRAVSDRLRTQRAAVLMSGGLDSSSLAAMGVDRVMRGSPELGLHAFTYVYDRLMQDQERYYSGLVADALGVPIHFLVADGYPLYERAEHLQSSAPDPLNEPFQAIRADQLKSVGERSRVAITGDGGDPVFCGNQSCLTEMLSSFRIGELVKSAAYFWLYRRRLPRLGIRTLLRKALRIKRSLGPEYPTWLNASFEARYELRARLA